MTTTSSRAQSTQEVLGVVLNGQFISAESHHPIEVTEAQMQDAIDPRAKLIDLGKYEGKAILISCQTNDGSFLWGSNVASTAGPILTAVVRKVFDLK
jgi:hypothetical protein